ncbi:PucR family transcriptional regulator [Marmoricola sp. RAF53]|uniref:PucR family transcriptional regulator n=1 Tax=Marmoricola sp. RAF53 TaxID=3233059 RepID=UPI003F96C8DB
MASDLQRLVDHLGNRLGRSVAIDDAQIRLLAYNAHTTGVDAIRVDSIMHRRVSQTVRDYLRDLDVQKAEDVFTVPARPSMGLTVERTGMPIRRERVLLGFIWFVGSDGPVTDMEADALREAAGQAALILHQQRLAGEFAIGQERELLRDLLAEDPELHVGAAEQLVEQELINAGRVTALVATVSQQPGEPLAERDRVALSAAVELGRRRLPPRAALTLQRPGHALLVTVSPAHTRTGETPAEVAFVVREKLMAESGRDSGTCWVGIGGTCAHISDLRHSYNQAWRAAEVARVTGVVGPIADYANLGVYALLSHLSSQQLSESLHPGVRSLLQIGSGHDDLVATLTMYLENAGDIKRTSDALYIHRATLYNRLRRIETLSGLDLSRGEDRLTAHLSLKVARLLEVPPVQQ